MFLQDSWEFVNFGSEEKKNLGYIIRETGVGHHQGDVFYVFGGFWVVLLERTMSIESALHTTCSSLRPVLDQRIVEMDLKVKYFPKTRCERKHGKSEIQRL